MRRDRKQVVSNYCVAFGYAIKMYRHHAGIPQELFAYKIGVNRTYMTDVELGRRSVGLEIIKKIADGFGVSVSQFMTSVDEVEKNIIGQDSNE